ncbi:MAG: hypothetical protein A3I00_08260 [Betaproteobacteria bacterium RIFCSPLOWO2_02_FULL_64_12]|nr:MAG: hypothetical protein A3I00_08260 [Betaproteobacteria bacterium RIFCSPLOWO2_02_FULL_64_12]
MLFKDVKGTLQQFVSTRVVSLASEEGAEEGEPGNEVAMMRAKMALPNDEVACEVRQCGAQIPQAEQHLAEEECVEADLFVVRAKFSLVGKERSRKYVFGFSVLVLLPKCAAKCEEEEADGVGMRCRIQFVVCEGPAKRRFGGGIVCLFGQQ